MSNETRVFSKRDQRIVLFASCIAIFITPLMGSMVVLALSTIGTDFGISTHDQGWITTAYFLSSVVFLVPLARGSDLIGKRKVFMTGLLVTIAGASLASFAPSFGMLLLCRIIMGAGGAAISCTSVAMISEVYPRHQRGTALGLNTAMVYAGSSLGPVLGGFLVDSPLGWHSTFYMVIPFCVVAFAAIWMFKTEFVATKGEPFDYKGTFLFGAGITAATYGMLNIPHWYSVPLMAAGVAVIYLFYRMQKKEQYPVLNVRVFEYKKYTRSVITTLLNYASSFAVSFFVALYLQDVYDLTARQAGMVLLIQPVIQTVFTPLTGRLSDRMDDRILPTVGMIFTTLGLLMITTFTAEKNFVQVAAALVMLGFGFAMFSAPNTNVVMSSVSERLYSEASGTLSMMRQAGMLVSMGIALGCVSLFMGDAGITDSIYNFMNAMRATFIICAAMCVIGTFLSWFRGKNEILIRDP